MTQFMLGYSFPKSPLLKVPDSNALHGEGVIDLGSEERLTTSEAIHGYSGYYECAPVTSVGSSRSLREDTLWEQKWALGAS